MRTSMATSGHVRRGAWAVAVLAFLIFAASPCLADKVVQFKNGKTMRAKSVKEDKGWTRLELDGGLVGVRSVEIAQVQEVTSAAPAKADAIPNQAAGGGGGGGYVGPSYAGGDAPVEAPPPPEDYQAQQQNDNSNAKANQYRGNQGGQGAIPGLRPTLGGRTGLNGGGFNGLNGGVPRGLSNSRFGGQPTPNLGRQPINNQAGNNGNGDD